MKLWLRDSLKSDFLRSFCLFCSLILLNKVYHSLVYAGKEMGKYFKYWKYFLLIVFKVSSKTCLWGHLQNYLGKFMISGFDHLIKIYINPFWMSEIIFQNFRKFTTEISNFHQEGIILNIDFQIRSINKIASKIPLVSP